MQMLPGFKSRQHPIFVSYFALVGAVAKLPAPLK